MSYINIHIPLYLSNFVSSLKKKKHPVQLMLIIYFGVYNHPLGVCWTTPNSSPPSSYQLPIARLLNVRWDFITTSSKPLCWDFVGLSLPKSCTCSQNCWVLVYNSSLVTRKHSFIVVIHISAFLAPFFIQPLYLGRRACDIGVLFRAKHSSVSCSLHLDQCGSLW